MVLRTCPLSHFSLVVFVPALCFFGRNHTRTGLTFTRSLPHTEFADVLEQLESSFYSEALSKFQESDFTAAGFPNAQLAIEQFVSIQSDEATHSDVLEVRRKA